MPMRWRILCIASGLLACSTPPEDDIPARQPVCDGRTGDTPGPTDLAGTQDLLTLTRALHVSALRDVRIDLVEAESEDSFFWANVDLSTAAEDPLERRYLVYVNTAQYADPPTEATVSAILVHELQHIVDYTEMDTAELVEFGLWYASGDIAAYERQTDEAALEAGCAHGLIEYREWLYGQVSAEVEAQKRVDYYTPEEIEAWLEEHAG